jgi:non-ribosomal peptide synthetase component F
MLVARLSRLPRTWAFRCARSLASSAAVTTIVGPSTRKQPSLMALFDKQVAAGSHRDALIFGSRRYNFGELQREADALAQQLQSRGIGPGVRVGVLVPRSERWVFMMLALARVGATYVPLDDTYPPARLKMMATVGLLDVVVTESSVEPLALSSFTGPVLVTDKPRWVGERGCSEVRPDAIDRTRRGPEDLHVIVFTSGSTGPPKSILHRQEATVASCVEALSCKQLDLFRGVATVVCSSSPSFTGVLPLAMAFSVVCGDRCVRCGGCVCPARGGRS